ncbi:MAG TPA: MgtC/SapB family protein [Candidatus Baltobacteraceae bacterium]|nr:MgtC/SapB family protein [Candidatus Baltobacteraceae bacterium]
MAFAFSPFLGIAGAAALGAVIGAQRQAAAKPAGLRTHLLVAAASAAFTAMGAHLGDTRIPSYVVVGIGFLGSGAIVRDGASARGLTTAASIWMAAAVGLLMGYANSFGLYCALTATVITMLALLLSDKAMLRLLHIPRKANVKVVCEHPMRLSQAIEELFRTASIKFENSDLISISNEGDAESGELLFLVSVPADGNFDQVLHRISTLAGVRRVDASVPFLMG